MLTSAPWCQTHMWPSSMHSGCTLPRWVLEAAEHLPVGTLLMLALLLTFHNAT